MSDVQLDKESLFQKVGSEAVLLDLKQGAYFQLNGMGTRMLDDLINGVEESEIINKICSEFDTTPEKVEVDLKKLVGELKHHGLLAKN